MTGTPITIFIDADACQVKQEIYRVAERHLLKGVALKVFVVSNSPIAIPRDEMIERVVVGSGMDRLTTGSPSVPAAVASSSPPTCRWRAAASRPAPR